MKNFILFLVILLFPFYLFSQTIRGKVQDQIEAIPYANVVLKDANNSPVTGTTTTEEGLFEIKVNVEIIKLLNWKFSTM